MIPLEHPMTCELQRTTDQEHYHRCRPVASPDWNGSDEERNSNRMSQATTHCTMGRAVAFQTFRNRWHLATPNVASTGRPATYCAADINGTAPTTRESKSTIESATAAESTVETASEPAESVHVTDDSEDVAD